MRPDSWLDTEQDVGDAEQPRKSQGEEQDVCGMGS